MPKRFTKKERKIIYGFLSQRDGEHCDLCGSTPPEVFLEVDHKEGTYLDYSPEKLRLLCKSCNRADGNRRRQRQSDKSPTKSVPRVSMREWGRSSQSPSTLKDTLDYQSGPVEMQANELFEGDFRNWLFAYLKENGSIDWDEAIHSGAQFVDCSSQSTERYLKKLTSLEGPLCKVKGSSRKWLVEFREERSDS
jgi:hypothetical protein